MKFKKTFFAVAAALLLAILTGQTAAEAKTSETAQQKEIRILKAENKKLKKQNKDKDSELRKYKAHAVQSDSAKLGYQGNIIENQVISYKGIKYAPITTIGELLNSKALFSKSSNTFYFGTLPDGTYMSDVLKPYYEDAKGGRVSSNPAMKLGGVQYNKGYQYKYHVDGFYAINLDGKYKQITGILGADEKSRYVNNVTVKFYGDGKLLSTYEIIRGELPLHVDLDVTQVKNFKVTVEGPNTLLDFVNIIIK